MVSVQSSRVAPANSLYLGSVTASSTRELRLGALVGALSYALDMTEGQPPGHCIRCCWIGTQIGQVLGMAGQDFQDLYFTLLLKDLGCSSNAARICELYAADDITFKRDFKVVDCNLSAALRFVFAKTGVGAGLGERLRATINVLQNGRDISRKLIETRCHRGAEIAAKMRFSSAVQNGILSLDEHWNGAGKPQGLKGPAVSRLSNIALLSQVTDVFHRTEGRKAAMEEVTGRAGTWFDPELVEAFSKASQPPEFWQQLEDPGLEKAVFALDPSLIATVIDDDYLDEIASAFSDVVDAKSPFTADHSRRVAFYTDLISQELGLEPAHRRWLHRAALLHDLGKLAVSNQILDKPGRPSDVEWNIIRSHPTSSRTILEKVDAFRDIAPIAGAHHERLDGKGYPNGLCAAELCLEVRILTVADVFDALSADRPYRAAMPTDEVFAVMAKDVGTAFDKDCFEALKRAVARLADPYPP